MERAADTEDRGSTLRLALTTLRPFLASFGLVPSRVIPFIARDDQAMADQSQQFPSKFGQRVSFVPREFVFVFSPLLPQ